MDIKQLRHFVAVVDTGSMSKATEEVHLTQPALTRSIKNLEALLQAELLERLPRGVVPTEAGRNLYEFATQIINETERATRDVTSIAAGEKGHVHVGIAALFSNKVIDDIVVELADRFPGLSVSIDEGIFEELVAGLRSAKLDVILSNFPPAIVPSGVKLEPLTTIHSHIVVGASHPLAKKKTVTVADLHDSRWAVINQPHAAELLSHFFAEDGLSPVTYAVETNSLTTLKSLVLTGRFITLLPEHWFVEEQADKRIKALVLAGMPLIRKAGLITRTSSYERPPVAKFIEVARKVLARNGSFPTNGLTAAHDYSLPQS